MRTGIMIRVGSHDIDLVDLSEAKLDRLLYVWNKQKLANTIRVLLRILSKIDLTEP